MPDAANTTIVRCCHCLGMMRVSAKALSIFCPHCQKRATLESLRIVGTHPGRTLATCGTLVVEPTARLNVEITARSVVINGRVNGGVTAFESVEVGPTGFVVGNIRAPKIVVRDGATIQGRCEMTRTLESDMAAAPANDTSATLDDIAAPPPESAEPPAPAMPRPRPLPRPD
jgi:cytoskeletal protein CcmA (bactofilin family)